MNEFAVVAVAGAAVAAVAIVAFAVTASARRSFATALDAAVARQLADRDAAVEAAVRHVDVFNRSYLDQASGNLQAELGASKELIGANLDAVRAEMRGELQRLGEVVAQLGEVTAQRYGRVDESLRAQAEAAAKLNDTTTSLREALANPQARGQWGERMADDVLRLAGFIENVNYRKQAQLRSAAGDGAAGRPDFTFDLPKGHVLHMDVKFPLAAYLRYLDADDALTRAEHLKSFLRDVRAKVKDLARRNYHEADRPSVDYVLLFLPNEQLTGFIHQHDPALLDDALGQRVVMCSPLTLFAFLGVIRQAFDNFVVEQRSTEILELVGQFGVQWRKYTESADKLKRAFKSVHDEFDVLTTTRERQLDRCVRQIENMRDERDLPAADATPLRAVGDGG